MLLVAGDAWTLYLNGTATFNAEVTMKVHATAKVQGETGVSGSPRLGEVDPRAAPGSNRVRETDLNAPKGGDSPAITLLFVGVAPEAVVVE